MLCGLLPGPALGGEGVQAVVDGHERVVQQHARAGVAHDVLDGLALRGRVAVHLALRAEGLGGHEPAALDARGGVAAQRGALAAELAAGGAMVAAAIDADHLRNHLALASALGLNLLGRESLVLAVAHVYLHPLWVVVGCLAHAAVAWGWVLLPGAITDRSGIFRTLALSES